MTVMTLKEAAKYLRYNPEKLRLKARDGLVPCKRIGHGPRPSYRFVREKLDAWLMEDPPHVDPMMIANKPVRQYRKKGGGYEARIRGEGTDARAGGADNASPAAGQPDHEDAA